MSTSGLFAVAIAVASQAPVTAEQALAAHRAMTSIGADSCRRPAGDEIIVCGRRANPYALPLPEAGPAHPESVAGGSRARLEREMAATTGPCAAQLSTCRPPPTVNLLAVGEVLVKGIGKLIEGE